MTDPVGGWPTGPGRHGRAKVDGGQRSFLRYRWYGALLAGIAAAALATGAIMLMNSHDGRLVSSDCGLVSCSAALPGSTSPDAGPQGSPRGKLTARFAPVHYRAAATRALAPSASPSAKASAARSRRRPPLPHRPPPHAHHRGHHGDLSGGSPLAGRFPGHFTLVNNGTTALSG
jgi:hypothetical protein